MKKFLLIRNALSVGGKNIRTYEEMADAWASDWASNIKVGLFLGPFLIFAGFYIAIKAKRGEYANKLLSLFSKLNGTISSRLDASRKYSQLVIAPW